MKNLFSIPARSHYGLVFLSYLVEAEDQVVSASHIAHELRIPQHYLEEVAWLLSRAGLVKGVRGMRGGYRLIRDPATITLREVFEALEGSLALTKCLSGKKQTCTPKCTARSCHTRELLGRIQQGITRELEERTLVESTTV